MEERYRLTISIIVQWLLRSGIWVYVQLAHIFFSTVNWLNTYPFIFLGSQEANLGYCQIDITLYIHKML